MRFGLTGAELSVTARVGRTGNKLGNCRRTPIPKEDCYAGEWRRVFNAELNQRYKEPNIVGVMKSRRLEWAGHLIRMSRERWPKIAMDIILAGKRPAGQPRKR
ncbi:hypothetical protein J437_LFUL003278 [Ladona fulva]|uniref:Uncharacterized protein n=1 Tax=Ladona fulva TaxID=123851 RepID=A0A8K0NXY6_LADFU|nr:hypothetical protein J437_LFUL003278 [Ladona fulva]